jgi:hypothetical protein
MRLRQRPSNAIRRAGLRWGLWHLALLPLVFACIVGAFLVLTDLTLRLHGSLASLESPDAFYCTPTRVSWLLFIPVIFSFSVPLGLVIGNCVLWIIPNARLALGRTSLRGKRSFAHSNAGLLRFALIVALLSAPFYILALNSRICLSDSTIFYKAHGLSPTRTYSLSQVREVRSSCTRGSRGGWDIGLALVLNDISFDLTQSPWFAASSERVLARLRGMRFDGTEVAAGCPIALRRLISPSVLGEGR